jgi:hypothetical protein
MTNHLLCAGTTERSWQLDEGNVLSESPKTIVTGIDCGIGESKRLFSIASHAGKYPGAELIAFDASKQVS